MNEIIEVNGKKYKAIDSEGLSLKLICVDNRGLLFVGNVDLSGSSEFVTIHDAQCIIVWGTTQHVAEICDGPTSSTRLGAKKSVDILRKNIIYSYDASIKGWGYE